jgi:acylphosphatase
VVKIARKLKVTGFVENLKPYDVKIVAEGEEDILDEFINQIRINKFPVFVEDLDIEFGGATREFEYFEIRRGDWKEELGERMDTAGAMLYRSMELGERSVELGERSVELGQKMLDKQDKMIEKQDTTIQVLRSVKEDTSQIREDTSQIKDIKEDTGIMKDKLTSLEEIHRDVLDLREKYDQLSDDVAGIKIMISGREAGCVFD